MVSSWVPQNVQDSSMSTTKIYSTFYLYNADLRLSEQYFTAFTLNKK